MQAYVRPRQLAQRVLYALEKLQELFDFICVPCCSALQKLTDDNRAAQSAVELEQSAEEDPCRPSSIFVKCLRAL